METLQIRPKEIVKLWPEGNIQNFTNHTKPDGALESDMKLFEVTDLDQQKLYVNPDQIITLIVPSMLAPGDGKCKLFLLGVMALLSRSEAERIVAFLGENTYLS